MTDVTRPITATAATSLARPAERKLAAGMARRAFGKAHFVPLGQFQQPTPRGADVKHIRHASAAVFWNLREV